MTAPLDGVSVIELTSWMAAPSAGAVLADLGADVVKIEPPRGDPMRGVSRQPKLDPSSPQRGLDPSFQVDNRGKRGIAVAIDQPAGADLVRRLAVDRHVFLTNLLPHRQARYGLDPAGLFAVNPRIVHATLSGYGRSGPEAWRPGYDVTAFFGRGAITDASLEPGSVPPLPRPAQGDHTTGLSLVVAVLAGLRLAERTGQGQVVDTSLFATAAWTMATDLAPTLLDRRPVTKRDRHHLISPLANRFRCADDRWIILNMPEAHWWSRFCDAVDRTDWAEDERFATIKGRFDHMPYLMDRIDEVFAARTLAEWGRIFDEAGLIWGPAQAIHELADDPQARAESLFPEVPAAEGRPAFPTVAVPLKVDGAEVGPRGPAPGLGQHTRVVLAEAGLSEAEIDRLGADGIIGAPSAADHPVSSAAERSG
jgi:crotonobetainyl-CoA:carnitine CoA-transferase CaiB-like acyl-CoA transferase